MTEYTVRITMRNHKILDVGWTADGVDASTPGDTIEVTFDLPDDVSDLPDSLYTIAREALPEHRLRVDADDLDRRAEQP